MSSHHQAVDELGEGLIVSALAEDGIVEAIEVPESEHGEWILGVQWHPEEIGTPAGQLEALLGALFCKRPRIGATAGLSPSGSDPAAVKSASQGRHGDAHRSGRSAIVVAAWTFLRSKNLDIAKALRFWEGNGRQPRNAGNPNGSSPQRFDHGDMYL